MAFRLGMAKMLRASTLHCDDGVSMPDQTQIDCPDCLGKGEVTKVQDVKPAADPPPIEMETCPRCGGTGRVERPTS